MPSSLSWPCCPPWSLKLFNASRHSTCIHSEYTTIAKLILRASKRVNDRPHRRDLRPGRSSSVMRGHIAPYWSRGEEVLMWSEDEVDDGKPSHPLARSTAWWISQSQQQGACFWTGTHAERCGMGATACSQNDGFGMSALGGEADISRISAKVRF